eukprot:TRINITY_DN3027_c0_g1_i1.p1 TRINITY_DN3027_c0_g1~~TRINITY_DN3027_c0_g1_i1.p1  ORF type:complete len:465 (-),score=153.58 TRINITY_DN3027_c0_g1_i1:127-1521(-)
MESTNDNEWFSPRLFHFDPNRSIEEEISFSTGSHIGAKHDKSKIAECMVDLWNLNLNESLLESTLSQLHSLCTSERNLLLIRLAGAIPVLLRVLSEFYGNSDQPTKNQQLSFSILASLAVNVSNRDEIRRKGGANYLFELLTIKKYFSPIEFLTFCKELSKNKKVAAHIRKEKLITNIIPYISEDDDISMVGLDAIYINLINEPTNQSLIFHDGGLDLMLRCLHKKNKQLRRRALRTIGLVLSNYSPAQKVIRSQQTTIELIVKTLSKKDESLVEAAASALCSAVENDAENQLLFYKAGSWKPLIRLLCVNNDTLRGYAASGVRSLVIGNEILQDDSRENGLVIPLLLDNLKSAGNDVKIHSAAALLELARRNIKNQKAIFEQDVVHPVVAALSIESETLQYLAGGIIWSLSKKSSNRKKAFIDAGAVEKLTILSRSSNEQLRQGSEWALQALKEKSFLGLFDK